MTALFIISSKVTLKLKDTLIAKSSHPEHPKWDQDLWFTPPPPLNLLIPCQGRGGGEVTWYYLKFSQNLLEPVVNKHHLL